MRRALYPGTFDPVHYGHLDLMQRAGLIFDELVVGVYEHKRPSKSVLFSVDERRKMIEDALEVMNGLDHNITTVPFSGLTVDLARELGIPVIVRGLRVFSDFEFEFRFALANRRMAPNLETVNLITREEHTFLSSTTVREIASLGGDVRSMVPPNVADMLYQRFQAMDESHSLRQMPPLRD
ncbi:MAG: pantetheine-phosphate adenylyltransferase [Chloroflexi bacterium]|nr:pantetheine-phosphate adenylyltransferase [Chloroflexota bacterium]